jgi:hypothetical protein
MADDVSMRLSGGSRLAVCPVCDKSVHVALVAMHVERCLTMHATTSMSCDAGVGTASKTTTTKRTTDTRHRGDPQDGGDRENEGGARRAPEASVTGRSGGVLKELAAARRANAARESASASVGVDLKRRRVALADATNAQGGGMRGFVKAVGATVARPGVDAATQTETENDDNDGPNALCADNDATVDEVDVEKVVQDVEGGEPSSVAFDLRVMSGNHEECGICLTAFDDADGVVRHMFYPCQHVRQCGECAQRVWQVPKAKRRCPWCKSKIEIRPRPFKPFL